MSNIENGAVQGEDPDITTQGEDPDVETPTSDHGTPENPDPLRIGDGLVTGDPEESDEKDPLNRLRGA